VVAQRHRNYVDDARLVVDDEHTKRLGLRGHVRIVACPAGSFLNRT
jgi:hypothetical protein